MITKKVIESNMMCYRQTQVKKSHGGVPFRYVFGYKGTTFSTDNYGNVIQTPINNCIFTKKDFIEFVYRELN